MKERLKKLKEEKKRIKISFKSGRNIDNMGYISDYDEIGLTIVCNPEAPNLWFRLVPWNAVESIESIQEA